MLHLTRELQTARDLLRERKFHELRELTTRLLAAATEAAPAELGELELLLGRAHDWFRDLNPATEAFERAQDHFEQAGLPRQMLQARLGALEARRPLAARDQSEHEAELCLADARRMGWLPETGEALLILAMNSRECHDYEHCLQLAREAADCLDPEEHRLLTANCLSAQAWALSALGRSGEAERCCSDSFGLLRELRDERMLRKELIAFSFQAWCQGDMSRARRLVEETIELALKSGHPAELASARLNLALICVEEERFAEARQLAVLAWQSKTAQMGPAFESAALMLLGLVAIHENNPRAALNYIDLAEKEMREVRGDEPQLLPYYSALVHAASGNAGASLSSWDSRSHLSYGVENRIEVRWLLRALRHLNSASFENLAGHPPATEALRRMESDLQLWLCQDQQLPSNAAAC